MKNFNLILAINRILLGHQFVISIITSQMRLLIILALAQVAILISYNASQSQIYQKYTIITHCTEGQITSWSCNSCKTLQKPENIVYLQNKLTSVMAYMWYSKSYDKFFVAFRGTTNIQNWLQDFTFYQVDYGRCKNCKVHEGFYLSYLSISQDIYQTINNLQKKYGNKPLIVLGGSLGAAIGMVAGIQIQIKYGNVEEIHTFGCPRVGNQQFSMYLKNRVKSTIRVIHNRDIVPHVPLQSQGFHHPSLEIFFNEQMNQFKICSEDGEDPSCSNAFYPNFSVQDHVSYWTKLNVHDICS